MIETGARTEDYGEHVGRARAPDGTHGRGSPSPASPPSRSSPSSARSPEAPAPSRADVGAPARSRGPPKETRGSAARASASEKEQRRQAARASSSRSSAGARRPRSAAAPVIGFFASCWAELKKVQWPDRDTLVQASAVTLIFVAIMAAYLGALDAAFNWLIKQIL